MSAAISGVASGNTASSDLRAQVCDAAREAWSALAPAAGALVLTGSVARDEATLSEAAAGDAEFVLVVEPTDARKADGSDLRQAIEAGLLRRGIACKVDVGVMTTAYLARMRPHIFAYELLQHGIAVAGNTHILERIPPFGADDIPFEDALRLLSNRVVELIELAPQVAADKALSPMARYRSIKLVLDSATSYLVFRRAYASTYRERAVRLAELGAAQSDDAPFDLVRFAKVTSACTAWKLNAGNREELLNEVFPNPLDLWQEAVGAAQLLWRWEMSRLLGIAGQVSNDAMQARWMSRTRARARLHGWLHVVRCCGGVRSWRSWPRWMGLALRATPRDCVYAAAGKLLFRLPCVVRNPDTARDPKQWQDAADMLPAAGEPIDTWQGLAGAIARNYRSFLVSTRS